MQALVVRLTAAVFALYGLAFVLAPAALARWITGSAPTASPGMIDLRATYGGMSVAVGILLFRLASRPSTVPLGLVGVVLLMLGMAAGGLYGMLVDGSPSTLMLVCLGLELAVAALAIRLLRSTPTARF